MVQKHPINQILLKLLQKLLISLNLIPQIPHNLMHPKPEKLLIILNILELQPHKKLENLLHFQHRVNIEPIIHSFYRRFELSLAELNQIKCSLTKIIARLNDVLYCLRYVKFVHITR